MFFLNALFQGKKTIDLKKRTHLKIRLEAQHRYYSEKVNFLACKKKNPHLAMLTCRDAPVPHKCTNSTGGHKTYLRNCRKYYQKKLTQINSKLKNI